MLTEVPNIENYKILTIILICIHLIIDSYYTLDCRYFVFLDVFTIGISIFLYFVLFHT